MSKNKKEDNIKNPKKEIEKYKKERDEYLEGWKRAKADFLNYKREEEERVENKIIRKQGSILQSLIIILDSFNLSLLSSNEKKIDRKGVKLIRNQLFDFLKKIGLEKINIEPGEEFNPLIHETVEQMESNYESGEIVEEVEQGYLFKNKVLRASKVKVSKGQKNKKIS